MQVDDGIFVAPLPPNEEDERGGSNDREYENKLRLKPVVALTFVQNDLQRTEAERDEAEANVVDFRFAQFTALEIGRVLDEARSEQERENPNWNVDEENPAPAVVVGNPSAQSRADRGSHDDRNTIDCERHAAFGGWKGVRQNGLFTGLEAAPACTLQNTKDNQQRQVRRESAEERTDGEKEDAAHVETLPPDDGRKPSAQRKNDRVRDEI